LAYFVVGRRRLPASLARYISDLTNPTARHADGINRIDVARIRLILRHYASALAVTLYLAVAFPTEPHSAYSVREGHVMS
jgi:hypothetical protein